MKKIIVAFVCISSLIACSKNEAGNESPNTAELLEDTLVVPGKNDLILNSKRVDSIVATAKDTAVVKIQQLNDQKRLLTEKVAKELDSASRTAVVSEIKMTQQKIDSVRNTLAKTAQKIASTPKVVRETKVIYRDRPKTKTPVALPQITKSGELVIQVANMENAQVAVRDQLRKYDAVIKNEQISSYQEQQSQYLEISVPVAKSDYLISDLESQVGKLTTKNIEIYSLENGRNAVCHLGITLTSDQESALADGHSKTFGGRSLGAVGSGWTVIQDIFIFLLPFWPVFLLGGGIYYYIRKKKMKGVQS